MACGKVLRQAGMVRKLRGESIVSGCDRECDVIRVMRVLAMVMSFNFILRTMG